jgi:hypothetical protein
MFGNPEGMTRPRKDLETVRDLLDQGLSISEAARRAGIPRGTIKTWVANGLEETLNSRIHDSSPDRPCEFCYYVRNLSETPYAYLLGPYLGDGYIAAHPRGGVRKSLHSQSTGRASFLNMVMDGSMSGRLS